MVSKLMLSHIIWTHAILATLSWALFFPLGAILVRTVTKNARNVHWPLQTFATLCFTAAFGLGVWIATTLNLWVTWNGHAIIGTTIFGLMWAMPILGILHRRNYISSQNSYTFAWIHVYLGRILILAGIINGGLGLQLGYYETGYASLRKGQIAYGVCAGVIALIWIAISVLACVRSKGDVNVGGESGPKVQGLDHLRNHSQDTAVAADDSLPKEKLSDEQVNGAHPAHAVQTTTAAVAPAVGTTTTTTTTTNTNTTVPAAFAQGDDIVHGGEHYNTRLADVIDPNVQKPGNTNMFA